MTDSCLPSRALPALKQRYFVLQSSCRRAVHKGNIARAHDLARRALAVAKSSGAADLIHRACTTRSMVYLEMDDVQAACQGLREVVLESADTEVICRAAFYLASALRRQKKISRALFFARKAADKAHELGDPVWEARCDNLLGNIYLNQCYLDRALTSYQRALATYRGLEGDHRFPLAIVLDNLGYCLILKDEVHRGLEHLQEGLHLALATRDRRTEAELRQDLAHAFLTLRKLPEAQSSALAALKTAEENGYRDIIRNCYYLLGELAMLGGNLEEGDAYFACLQRFFPDVPHLQRFLRMFDISSLLTLH
ncbi:MAG: tetratricopeptide repeat protein [Acidobacteriota bacterium]